MGVIIIIDSKDSHVKSVQKALILVDFMSNCENYISLTEISKKLGWPKSTVHGILATLRDYEYIEQSEKSGHYRLGIRFFEIGSKIENGFDITKSAKFHMKSLNEQTGETVHLATEASGEVLYIRKIDSTKLFRIVSETGSRLPMHCTGLGKVLLAYKDFGEVKKIMQEKGMEAFTPNTITNLPSLEAELQKIKHQGYSVDDNEIMEGLRCVAVPIFDSEGEVRYSLSVSAISGVLKGEYIDKIIRLTKETAQRMSYEIGYRKN